MGESPLRIAPEDLLKVNIARSISRRIPSSMFDRATLSDWSPKAICKNSAELLLPKGLDVAIDFTERFFIIYSLCSQYRTLSVTLCYPVEFSNSTREDISVKKRRLSLENV